MVYYYSVVQNDADGMDEVVLSHNTKYSVDEFGDMYNSALAHLIKQGEDEDLIDASDIAELLCSGYGFERIEPEVSISNPFAHNHTFQHTKNFLNGFVFKVKE